MHFEGECFACNAVRQFHGARGWAAHTENGGPTSRPPIDLARWGHGGVFSLRAGVLIEAADRSGLERLLRYCARPASIHQARLLARICELRPLSCPPCHGDMRLIAFLTEPPSVRATVHRSNPPSAPHQSTGLALSP